MWLCSCMCKQFYLAGQQLPLQCWRVCCMSYHGPGMGGMHMTGVCLALSVTAQERMLTSLRLATPLLGHTDQAAAPWSLLTQLTVISRVSGDGVLRATEPRTPCCRLVPSLLKAWHLCPHDHACLSQIVCCSATHGVTSAAAASAARLHSLLRWRLLHSWAVQQPSLAHKPT